MRTHLYQSGRYWVTPTREGFAIYKTLHLGHMRCAVINHGGDIGLTLARTKCDHLAEDDDVKSQSAP